MSTTSGTKPSRAARMSGQSPLFYKFGRWVVGLVARYWIRCFRGYGMENVPAGACYLVANHTSGLDPFIVGLPLRDHMLAGPGKAEIFENPLAARVMRLLGIFPLRKDLVGAGAVRIMVALYREGRPVVVYPEGGRSRSGEMQAFEPGFVRLAIRMKACLVPVGIAGARESLPMGSLLPRSNVAVAVVYGKPFDLASYDSHHLSEEDLGRAVREVEERVAACVAEARRHREEQRRECGAR